MSGEAEEYYKRKQIDDIKRLALDLHTQTRGNPEMWDTGGICLLIGALLNKCTST